MRVFLVYRLVFDAKPNRVMMWPAENLWACSRIFRRTQHQWLARDICIKHKGFLWFLSFQQTPGILWWTTKHSVSAERTVYFCLSPCDWCKTRKGDDVAGWKYLSLLKDFLTATASMARKRHFASSTRGFYGFCLFCRNGPSHKKARSGGADRKGIIFKNKGRLPSEPGHSYHAGNYTFLWKGNLYNNGKGINIVFIKLGLCTARAIRPLRNSAMVPLLRKHPLTSSSIL